MKNKAFIIHPSPTFQRDVRALEQRRLKAAQFFEKGINQAEVARKLKVSRPAVHYWYTTWKRKGKEGLKRSCPGQKSPFTRKKLQTVECTLLKGATASGYATNLWTLQRVAQVIRKETHHSLGQTHTWRILRAMGWSSQKPETRYRDRNDAAIQRWKQKQWPAIQKRG